MVFSGSVGCACVSFRWRHQASFIWLQPMGINITAMYNSKAMMASVNMRR
jgi:hypothetical protein